MNRQEILALLFIILLFLFPHVDRMMTATPYAAGAPVLLAPKPLCHGPGLVPAAPTPKTCGRQLLNSACTQFDQAASGRI
jgi:hypothetical protein